MLVMGTSLTVLSAFRLVRRMLERERPGTVCVVNSGPTRADKAFFGHPNYLRHDGKIGDALTFIRQ